MGYLNMQGRRFNRATAAGASVVGLALLLAACSSSSSSSSSSPSASASSGAPALSGTLNASGSSFQTNFQQAAISAFKQIQPGMTVNYGGGGSGKGQTDLAGNVVNFAGSDIPIPASAIANYQGKTVLYFPILIGPITVSYNLSGVSKLQMSGPTLAGIFSGKITTWDDPAIKADNPGVTLPSTAITMVHRSDASGTTANFSQFLVDAGGSAWTLGTSATINWPANSQAGNGNGGVAGIISKTPGAIGYVDYSDAKAAGLVFASVKNQSGDYIVPTPASASAGAGHAAVKPDLTFSAIWAPGAAAYPIAYQTWDLVYAKQPTANDAAMLKAYLGYLIGDGQKLLGGLGFAPLPSNIDQKAVAQLSQITS